MKQYPDDKDALLFCGLGHQAVGSFQKAHEFYAEALKRMGSEERTMMESIDLIAKEEERRLVAVQRQKNDTGGVWTDSPEQARFWQAQDPLFLTPFNERRMEHYGRVAYANIRFGQPSRRLEGWQTDMGRTYIKFGRSIHQVAEKPDADAGIGVPPITLDFHPSFYSHLETWFYEGFKVTFMNWDGLDGWGFSTEKEFGIEAGRRTNAEPSSRYVFHTAPPRYVDPYRDKKYSLPHQIAAFQEGDSIRVELSYAIPKDRLRVSWSKGAVELEDGFFLFNENWEEVYRKIRNSALGLPASERPGATGADSLRRSYLLAQRQVRVRPGSYHVVIEARNGSTGSIGTFREARAFSFADTALAMSDLLLASQIESRDPSPQRREDLSITPNPLRTFHRSEAVSVYFEVYNLRPDRDGRTEYEVSYRVGRPEKKEVDPALFAALDAPEAQARVEIERVVREEESESERIFDRPGGPVEYRVRYVLPERNRISDQAERIERAGKGAEIAVTARYAGERRDDFAYLQIDMTWMPRGVYRLTVAVRDARTGRCAEREALFRVVE